jgi:hypothetical protein
MDSRTLRLLVIVGVVLGAVGAGLGATGFINPAPVSDGVPLGAPNGLYVTVEGDTDIGLANFTAGNDTVVVETTDGNATVQAGGPADVTLAATEITGTWTNATTIRASLNPIRIDPEDKTAITVGGGIEHVGYKDAGAIAADDGTVDFYYGGAKTLFAAPQVVTIQNGTEFFYGGRNGTSRVTIHGAPPDTQLGAVDVNNNTLLDIATSDSNGEITFDALRYGKHTVALVTGDRPELSNPSPTSDLDSEPGQLSIDVDDPDFDADSVTVNITLDGSQIHTETLNSAGTVTTSIPSSGTTGGEHVWTVEATDQYGNTRTETYSYRVPDTLFIRNETNASQLIDSPVTVDVSFFTQTGVVTRSATNGTVNLTGLPVGGDFVADVDASESNYTERTAYIQSIYQQQTVYLLNTNVTDTIESRFVLEDPTGQFGAETVLFVEKPINATNSTTYQTVAADEFGVEGVTATLQQGQRYRLRVQNQQGVTQVVGPYRADVSETVTVRPGTPTINIDNVTNGWGADATLDNRTLSYRYEDRDDETDQLDVSIYRRGDPDRLLVDNETFFDVSNVSNTITLNATEKKQTWVVRFEADRGDETVTKEKLVSNRPDVLPDLGRNWRLISGILLLFLSAGAFSLLNAKVGAVVVAAEGGLLWWIGWLEGATTGVLVVLALFIAVVAQLYDR